LFDYILGDAAIVAPLELSTVTFRLVWVIVVGAHTLCAAFLAGCAAAYWYLTDPLAAFHVKLWAPKSGNKGYTVYAGVFGAVGVLHVLRVLQLLCRSVRARCLVLRGASSRSAGSVGRARVHSLWSSREEVDKPWTQFTLAKLVKTATRSSMFVQRLWKALFSRRGLFGVENKHFLTVFILREMLEVATQTYQVCRCSHLLPRVWLNTFLAVLLLANCWSMLVVEHFFGRRPTLERVVALSGDAGISILMSVVIPTLIVSRHLEAFDLSSYMLKDPYDPVLIASFVLEIQLVFASSAVDFALKLAQQLAIFLALVTVGALLSRRGGVVVVPCHPGGLSLLAPRGSTLRNSKTCPASDTEAPAHLPAPLKHQKAWIHTIAKVLFCMWGIAVLGLHSLAAAFDGLDMASGCRASTRPWLVQRASCSSLVINCRALGTASPDEETLSQLDAPALATLTFAHCPALRMPSAIQRFRNLLVLQVYNSTVVDWAPDAISESANTRLVALSVVRSHFPSGFPQGLTHPLPTSLLSIQFCVTDIAALPSKKSPRWHPMAVVAFDNSQMTAFPTSLLSVQSYVISLNGNQLETISELAALPPGQTFGELSLKDNPLRKLPPALGSRSNLFLRLDLQGTNVSTLPAWTRTQVLDVVYMHNTPYCLSLTDHQPNVQCTPREDLAKSGDSELLDRIYPL
jgi:hypothetical protein